MSYEKPPHPVTGAGQDTRVGVASGRPGTGSKSAVKRVLAGALDVLFPRICVHCREPVVDDPAVSPMGRVLCLRCRGDLRPCPRSVCDRCGRIGSADSCPCGGEHFQHLDAIHWSWVYSKSMRSMIQAMKFRRLDFLCHDLGVEGSRYIADRLPALDVVVEVPMHWGRRWRRGYDQSRGLAKAGAQCLELPWLPALRRRRHTATQSRLGEAERLRNLRRAFITPARMGKKIAGRRVLLVDDVMTTGATLDAAAWALKAAGAEKIVAWTVARTPQKNESSCLTVES